MSEEYIAKETEALVGSPISRLGELPSNEPSIIGIIPHSDDAIDGKVQIESGDNFLFIEGSIWVESEGKINEGDTAYYKDGKYNAEDGLKVGEFESSYDDLNIVRLSF